MGRRATQSATIVAQDQQRLLRIMLRAQQNTERPRKINEELIAALNRCIAILAGTANLVGVPTPKKRTGT